MKLFESALYTPDYALGRIVAFQIAPRLRSGKFGAEVERMTRSSMYWVPQMYQHAKVPSLTLSSSMIWFSAE